MQEGWNEDDQQLYPSDGHIYESSDEDGEGDDQTHGELGVINVSAAVGGWASFRKG